MIPDETVDNSELLLRFIGLLSDVYELGVMTLVLILFVVGG